MDRWVRVSHYFVPLVVLASACGGPSSTAEGVRPPGPTLAEGTEPIDVAAVSSEIRGILSRSVQAWNRGDLDDYLSAYSDQPLLTYVRGDSVFTGKRALRERVERAFAPAAGEPDDLSLDDIEVSVLGPGHALVTGQWTTYQPGFDTQPVTGRGRFTMVFRDEALGWRIAHEHAS